MRQWESGDILEQRYRILFQIGGGGSASVYLAEDIHLGKQWALKWMDAGQGLAEVRVLREMCHPGIPMVVDSFVFEESCCMVMEYVKGQTLAEWMESHGKTEEKMVVNWLYQVLGILQYLHERRPAILHLDIKPENLMLDAYGRIHLLDYGTALSYQEKGRKGGVHRICGTPGYASPEQLRPEVYGMPDQKSDIFSLGVTAFYLLTGVSPVKPPYLTGQVRDFQPSVSRALNRVIQKAMSIKKVKRQQSCRELLQDLERVKAGRQLEKYLRRVLGTVVRLSYVLAIILAGLGWEWKVMEGWEGAAHFFVAASSLALLGRGIGGGLHQLSRRKCQYTERKNILLTEKKEIGLWGLLFLAGIVLGAVRVRAEEEPASLVTVMDVQKRNILIRENTLYMTEEKLWFVPQTEPGEEIQFSVRGGEWQKVCDQSYVLDIDQLKEEKEVQIIFRKKMNSGYGSYVQKFRMAYCSMRST